MNDLIKNNETCGYFTDKILIDMYKEGYSINYIAKKYYKYKNKNKKPLKMDGFVYIPVDIFNMDYCRLYVTELIFKYNQEKYKTSSII